jgi:hypothetical protein
VFDGSNKSKEIIKWIKKKKKILNSLN